MKLPSFLKSATLPFDGIQMHAEKIKECAWSFQQAIECYFSNKCDRFEEYLGEVNRLENEADDLKRGVRASISKTAKMPVDKFNLFMYITEQDKVLDCVEECLSWISYRSEPSFDEDFKNDFHDLVDSVIAPIEELSIMVAEARIYFSSYSEKQRAVVIDLIQNLRKNEHESDKLEDALRHKIFNEETNPIAVFHMVELTYRIGAIADHAENTGDMMRAMIEKY